MFDYSSLIYKYSDDVASYNGYITKGFFEYTTIQIFNEVTQSEVLVSKKSFCLATNSLPGLKNNSKFLINNQEYTADMIYFENDGKDTRIILQNVG